MTIPDWLASALRVDSVLRQHACVASHGSTRTLGCSMPPGTGSAFLKATSAQEFLNSIAISRVAAHTVSSFAGLRRHPSPAYGVRRLTSPWTSLSACKLRAVNSHARRRSASSACETAGSPFFASCFFIASISGSPYTASL